jgi:Mg2+ and Co2+ transporter CorA
MVLSETFGFHDIAIRDCLERNHISKLHVYDDHVFTVLHAPEIGSPGHVHYVELDQFLDPKYLVAVHGPLNPAVDPAVAYWTPNRSGSGSRTAGCTRRHRSSCPPRSCPR